MLKVLLASILLIALNAQAQTLKIRGRKPAALNGSQFAASISDTGINLAKREKIIFKAIKKGNVPEFYRKLVLVTDSAMIDNKPAKISYYTIPDYIAIGTDTDYFYCPMTPALAQRVANKLKCSLPTRKMVNAIYATASIKLSPMPLLPGPAMTTVPVFVHHNEIVRRQLDSLGNQLMHGALVAGDKKDVIISNRIYNDTSAFHVVIYGWHKKSGKAIQPLYARHLSSWADYSHGIRLIQRTVWVNGKKTSIKKVLRSEHLNVLLSDEGPIKKPFYPTHVN
ncbi:hypothetical protein BEL04_04925 [Mucilaginibacter sp. PPCGB 2223]|uniref:hypothetical protein n=1 Tax=Mucilaginibacter sp. PPCGB 2223 TaxID=1886027 RepID=UPI00082547AE|nr:hypothetical protein [Mucilaginibacter sp. PPCGB 2223]OCX53640.1 hypothetical protein BEL04_04925 [Mucilaginibacter sp. PPCGB 2223]